MRGQSENSLVRWRRSHSYKSTVNSKSQIASDSYKSAVKNISPASDRYKSTVNSKSQIASDSYKKTTK